MNQFEIKEISTLDELISELSKTNIEHDIDLIKSAYELTYRYFGETVRKSGQLAMTHYLSVAVFTARLGLGTDSVIAALMHQIVSKTEETMETIAEKFGDEIALLIDGLTKLKTLTGTYNVETASEEFVNLLFSASDDIRIILIRLMDKLHSILSIDSLEESHKVVSARKVINIYAPLAEYLGLGSIQRNLEDVAFRILKPDHYEKVIKYTNDLFKAQENMLKHFETDLNEMFSTYAMKNIQIEGRKKGLYSSYRKFKDKYTVNFDDVKLADMTALRDFFAFRIIVPNIEDCYVTLGLIHSKYEYSQGDFEDYISKPKENGYKSIHTVVIYKEIPLEVQIRTVEMHEYNEFGPASHIAYKLKRSGKKAGDLTWTKELNTWKDKKELTKDDFKIKAFQNSIFVFTPKGKVIKLRTGSRPLDFAFRVHTGIGLRYTGALVNGKIVKMDHELKTGDIIEILTGKQPNARWAWLQFVNSPATRGHIKRYLSRNVEKS